MTKSGERRAKDDKMENPIKVLGEAYCQRKLERNTVEENPRETEMEKRADSADISVLFFLIAVLIFWLYTRKQTVLFCTVLLALYY